MRGSMKWIFKAGILFFTFLCGPCGCMGNDKKSEAITKKSDEAEETFIEEKPNKEETEAFRQEYSNKKSKEPVEVPVLTIEKEDFVNIKEYIPNIYIDLKYSTTDNFTGQKVYDFSEAYLRYGTVEKLLKIQNILEKQGLSLKIWDAFRPTAAQYALWDICPDATYVANPNNGFSSHSRGNTVDITLVNKDGKEVEMPTEFDDFSPMADRDYSDCSEEAGKNAEMLEQLMIENGFSGHFEEWWHYTDLDEYPVEKFLPTSTE